MAYPSTPIPRFGSTRGKKLEALRSQTEAGYTFSRKKFTRSKAMFELSYKNITLAEYLTLENFFVANQGSIFAYTHPITGNTYNCIFAIDEIKATDTTYGRVDTNVSLVEV